MTVEITDRQAVQVARLLKGEIDDLEDTINSEYDDTPDDIADRIVYMAKVNCRNYEDIKSTVEEQLPDAEVERINRD
jgi:hypothetical protein